MHHVPPKLRSYHALALSQFKANYCNWRVVEKDTPFVFNVTWPGRELLRIAAAPLSNDHWAKSPLSAMTPLCDTVDQSPCSLLQTTPLFVKPYLMVLQFTNDRHPEQWLIVPADSHDDYYHAVEDCDRYFYRKMLPMQRLLALGLSRDTVRQMLDNRTVVGPNVWSVTLWALRILKIEKGDRQAALRTLATLIDVSKSDPKLVAGTLMEGYPQIKNVPHDRLHRYLEMAQTVVRALPDAKLGAH